MSAQVSAAGLPAEESKSEGHAVRRGVAEIACAALLAAMASSVLATHWSLVGPDRYPLDDPFIIDHAVHGIMQGSEDVYLDSSPWDGVTSPVYAFLVIAFSTVSSIPVAHWIVQALGFLLFVLGAYGMARQKRLHPALSLALTVVTLMSGMTMFHLFNGLETGWTMAAVMGMVIALESDRPPPWSYVLSGLCAFIRPELAALAGLAFIALLARRPHGWMRGTALAVVSFGAFALILHLAGGSVMPNTASAKQYFFATGCLPLADKIGIVAGALSEFIFLKLGVFAVGCLFLVGSGRIGRIAVAFALAFVAAFVIKYPDGFVMDCHRYLYVLLPFFLSGWTAFISKMQMNSKRLRGMRISNIAALGMVMATGVCSAMTIEQRSNSFKSGIQQHTDDYRMLSNWIAENIPPDQAILVHDAGMISNIVKNPLVDMVGLKTRFSMDINRETTWRQCTRFPDEALDRIALQGHARFAVVFPSWEILFNETEALRKRGWDVSPVDVGSSFNRSYKLYRLQPPEAGISGE